MRTFKKGEYVFKQGDRGNSCYIILKGSVHVINTDRLGNEVTLARLEKNHYFGEQALLVENEAGQRNASIHALTDLSLLEIPRHEFLHFLKENQSIKHRLELLGEEEALSRIINQHDLYKSVIEKLNESSHQKIEHFSNNNVIFKKGDPSDSVYLLLSGNVEISLDDHKSVISPGQLFGELGVIKNQVRAGTARSIEPVKAYCIQSDAFRKIYAELPELQKFIKSLHHMYQIKGLGLVEQYLGKVSGLDALFTKYEMDDGSIVLATNTIENSTFSISREVV
ncbi:cyclic nucleotide-binding domain-containing protein [Chlamydiales bacterium]|nr:cyclic nucleotide-binding domain-containing protein [Chlamydiales bacterium]